MIGQEGTIVAVADTPTSHDPDERPDPAEKPRMYEVGGTSVIVHRRAPGTIFAALHEPFEGGAGAISTFREIERGAGWAAYRIGGEGEAVDDRVYVRFDEGREVVSVTDGPMTVEFTDHALVRRLPGRIEAFGDVRSIRVRVGDEEVAYYQNGRRNPAKVENGVLRFDSPRG